MQHPQPHSKRWFPPEWAAQQAVILTWPHDHSFRGTQLVQAEQTFLAMANAIAPRERLVVICRDEAHFEHLQGLLAHLDNISLIIAPSNDIWVRDHGPIGVIRDGELELLDFSFNGWGNKYPADLDNAIPAQLENVGVFPNAWHTQMDNVLEGGSLETDGQGTLLTTSRCLLNHNRNGSVDRDWVEQRLGQWFGCRQVLWLDHGALEGDDTDSHIDMLARFAPDNRILHTACDDPADSHYADLAAMAGELARMRNADGEPYALRPLPWPPETRDETGARMPLSYANFLVINGAVLVPVYDVATDQAALDLIADSFPGREVIGIPALALIRQHGSVHCASMQVPFAEA